MSQDPQLGSPDPTTAPTTALPEQTVDLLRAGLASDPADTSGRTPPPTPTELAPHFPQLEIHSLLGRGGMGAVYRVTQKHLEREAALKVLPAELGRDPAFASRFEREARTLARLNHPHLVAVYDFGRTGDWCWLLMELVDGANLRQVLQTGSLAAKEALALVPQLCDALQYAHDEGVVHRDIKPENILLDKRGRVKIADFGLAKLAGTPAGQTLTHSGDLLGTAHYMAPEQVERSCGVDHRADIYSLGVVLYEMLTGGLPLGRFDPPSRRFQVDVRLDEVVLKALEKDPDRRYQQASHVQRDVAAIGADVAAAATAETTAAPGKKKGKTAVNIGLDGIHVVDGDDEVHVGLGGIRQGKVDEGEEKPVAPSPWQALFLIIGGLFTLALLAVEPATELGRLGLVSGVAAVFMLWGGWNLLHLRSATWPQFAVLAAVVPAIYAWSYAWWAGLIAVLTVLTVAQTLLDRKGNRRLAAAVAAQPGMGVGMWFAHVLVAVACLGLLVGIFLLLPNRQALRVASVEAHVIPTPAVPSPEPPRHPDASAPAIPSPEAPAPVVPVVDPAASTLVAIDAAVQACRWSEAKALIEALPESQRVPAQAKYSRAVEKRSVEDFSIAMANQSWELAATAIPGLSEVERPKAQAQLKTEATEHLLQALREANMLGKQAQYQQAMIILSEAAKSAEYAEPGVKRAFLALNEIIQKAAREQAAPAPAPDPAARP